MQLAQVVQNTVSPKIQLVGNKQFYACYNLQDVNNYLTEIVSQNYLFVNEKLEKSFHCSLLS